MPVTSSIYRQLGQTGIQVSPIGLGVMEFSGREHSLMGGVYPAIPQEEKNAIVQAALAGGINWFDTAEAYGFGVSERSLAEALKANAKQPGAVVVATKWLPVFRTAGNMAHMRRWR